MCSSFGIETGYGLDGRGLEGLDSRRGLENFSSGLKWPERVDYSPPRSRMCGVNVHPSVRFYGVVLS